MRSTSPQLTARPAVTWLRSRRIRRNTILWFDLAVASTGKARTRAAGEALRLNTLYPEIAAGPRLRAPKRR